MSVFEDDYRRNCAYCEDEFLAKRTNQVYCCHRCKYTCNNRKRDFRSKQISKINKLLIQNFEIAKRLWDKHQDKATFEKQQLSRMGYHFQYFTHYIKLNSGSVAMGIYNFSLVQEGDNYTILNIDNDGL